MTPQALNNHQRINTRQAYGQTNFEWSSSVLEDIVAHGIDRKHAFFNIFGETGTVVTTRDLTHDELTGVSYTLQDLEHSHPDYAFNFPSKTVTERSSGNCFQLKKFLQARNWETPGVQHVLELASQQRMLLMSAHPWFLIGGSVAANGENIASSCHHPNSSHADYKSGAISYGIDRSTIMFGLWDPEYNGLIGRQLVYIDREAPGIITGRKYGSITEMDSSHLRKHLYKLIRPEISTNAWKKTKDYHIEKDGFRGYLDDGYFEGFRPQKDNRIEIILSAPMCPSCGEKHYHGTLVCEDCNTQDSAYSSCEACGCDLDEDDCYGSDDGTYCESCFYERYFRCDGCGDAIYLENKCHTDTGYDYCEDCADRRGYSECEKCGDWSKSLNELVNSNYVCDGCLPNNFVTCHDCGRGDNDKYMYPSVEGEMYCKYCVEDLDTCDECGCVTSNGLSETTDGINVCTQCVEDKYIYTCPSCNCVSETEGACCQECATDNLFLLAA